MKMQAVRSQTRWTGAVRLAVLVILAVGCHFVSNVRAVAAVPEKPTPFTPDLAGGVKMEFVLIRPGSFMMGSEKGGESDEKPVHKVTIAKPFYLGKYEVTQEQWQAVMGSTPSHFKGPENPVESVSWDDCREFLKKINEKFPAMGFRLPTEAEWEYACRAGSATEYCYGDGETGFGDYAWYGDSGGTTHPVGEKKSNAWGLYDMHGNVAEWCLDWYHDSYNGAPWDGSAWELPAGSTRVVRGGHWYFTANGCRSASRFGLDPGLRGNGLGFGFRFVRTQK